MPAQIIEAKEGYFRKQLIQEKYKHDPWKMLCGCIMLNQTSNVQVWRVVDNFFERFPNPESISEDSFDEIKEITRTLGFYNRRAKQIIRFSDDWLNKKWNKVTELYGIGKYASDSYEIFVKGNLKVMPTDSVLRKYLRENGIEINNI